MTFSENLATVNQLTGRPADELVPVTGSDRVIAADIDGTTDGVPVVYLHGTPDSRLARHPDASIVDALGIRLVAVDRPGFGHSSLDPVASPGTYGTDIAVLLDHLRIDAVHLLAWSAGATWALGAAATLGDRVRSTTIVGGLIPFEAFTDPQVRAGAGDARLGMVETAEELGAALAAEMIAPLLVPDPPTPAAALEHRAEAGDTALSTIPGADVVMAAACCDSVRCGMAGLIHDVTMQLSPSGLDLAAVTSPARFLTGTEDTTCPPAFAHWYSRQLAEATVEIVSAAGHGLLLTHWRDILAGIAHPQ